MSWKGLAQLTTSRNYIAVYEYDPDEHVWLVHIKGMVGCHTHGRTIRQAETRIREALAVWLDRVPGNLVITSEFPRKVTLLASKVSQARDNAMQAGSDAQNMTSKAAHRLAEMGLSRRDTADLLGISHQRVQQLLAG